LKHINKWIEDEIVEFTQQSHFNTLNNNTSQKAWDRPIIGVSSGEDNYFQYFKDDIGQTHWTPKEVFNIAFPSDKTTSSDLRVLSWILPKSQLVKNKNSIENRIPSEKWIRAKIYGEEFNRILRKHIVDILSNRGFKAVAPVLLSNWSWNPNDKHGYISNWSERHAAFISGLGTFGLCEGLITPLGKAVRIGSVVTNAPIDVTARTYTDYHEYCLYFSRGACRVCEKRCPANSITNDNHDKLKCRAYINSIMKECESKYKMIIKENSCGLCQTKVPCESGIPVLPG
jgi:epoxyqueuosine reductase